ncbi:MAG TPA: DUF2244 domain-containing protein [Candidatus Binatia bacterium]|nr:DUF2244 domain-containing protein [Candidatus Binatia bacterium]
MTYDAQLVIGPNASLTRRQAGWVMAGMSGVGLGVAGVWTALGFWPVLPFAGLELAAFGAALAVCMHRNRYREVLRFSAGTVRIEFGLLGQGPTTQLELPRAWTRVELARGEHRHEPTALWLCCSGQRVRIGVCLTDEDRSRLAARIGDLLKPHGRKAAAAAPATGTPVARDWNMGD